jgi:mRNA-degrading endonuclease RelE of RelBE toxin-antitoxin system
METYKIVLDKKVVKFLKLHQELRWNFLSKLKLLSINDTESLDIKPLLWLKDCYRLRIWGYRFLYKIKEKEILIYFYNAWNRWDVYK